MKSAGSSRLSQVLSGAGWIFAAWFILIGIVVDLSMTRLQKDNAPGTPFGLITLDHSPHVFDFTYNLIYLHGIQERLVARPYRIEDQQQLIERLLPGVNSGMTHPYSPVALVLAQPLLAVSSHRAYQLYLGAGLLGTILLFQFHLLPATRSWLQLYALALCAVSVWFASTLAVGQTSLLTTACLGAFWIMLQRRSLTPSLALDVALALTFWALCLKPSVTIIPAMLLLGAKAWRPLLLGIVLLLVNWTMLADHYGGWWTGLGDYAYLLNHYNTVEFTPFMQRHTFLPMERELTLFAFDLHRNTLFVASALLLLLRWRGRIDASEHLRGMVAIFLLVSPYLMPTENWVLCLLVVEGRFFLSDAQPVKYLKLLLLAAIFDLHGGLNFPIDGDAALKAVLFLWMWLEWWRERGGIKSSSVPTWFPSWVPSRGTRISC